MVWRAVRPRGVRSERAPVHNGCAAGAGSSRAQSSVAFLHRGVVVLGPVPARLNGVAGVCASAPVGSRSGPVRPAPGHGRSPAQRSHSTPMTVRHLDTPSHGQCQVRSLTGAVHLQNNNGGVQRSAQCGQKPHAEHKDKSWLDLDVQYILRQRKLGLTILLV